MSPSGIGGHGGSSGVNRGCVIGSPALIEELEVLGESRPSYRYRLAAGALNLDLWYSTDNEWLALESEVKGGRKLRYEPF